MDYKALYAELTEKMENELPIKAFPIREIVQIFRNKGYDIILKSALTIIKVYNTGDETGILCVVQNDSNNNISCSLTHLLFRLITMEIPSTLINPTITNKEANNETVDIYSRPEVFLNSGNRSFCPLCLRCASCC